MDNGVEIGTGKSPDGVAVKYFEVDRPSTIGGKGAQGFVIEARDAQTGVKITHSDSLVGLQGAGYVVDELPKPDEASKAPEIQEEPSRETAENELSGL